MSQAFFELFSNLALDTDLRKAMEKAVVDKVAANRNRDAMRIYITCEDLIPKRRIWKLEKEIERQYFGKDKLTIHVIEKFHLSAQYTPENLYELYRDSIYEEINAYSSLMFGIVKKSDMVFEVKNETNFLTVTMEDTVLARGREQELHDILDKIFCDRCGQQLIIHFAYKEPVNSKYRAKSDAVIHNRIVQITEDQIELQAKRAEEEAQEGMPTGDLGGDTAVTVKRSSDAGVKGKKEETGNTVSEKDSGTGAKAGGNHAGAANGRTTEIITAAGETAGEKQIMTVSRMCVR